MSADGCDSCGEPISDALARTVRLTVDRSQIDAQRLCPECFAEWIDRYERVMTQDDGSERDSDRERELDDLTDDADIIVD